jgi:linker histone H1 and H5 family
MLYKAGIADAIKELNERNGSSMTDIKTCMHDKLPANKKWMTAAFLGAFKRGVAAGEFVRNKVRACTVGVVLVF